MKATFHITILSKFVTGNQLYDENIKFIENIHDIKIQSYEFVIL